MSLPVEAPVSEALGVLSRFRVEFYESLYARADVLFELTDAVLCADGPVKTLVELSLAVEHRRGHGALYAALDRGWPEPVRLRLTLAGLPLPRPAGGRIVLAVDVSNWLGPDAPTSPDRLFCHCYGRGGRASDQLVPGWPYAFVAALERGRTSWVPLLDAVRLGLVDDATAVTAAQLRDVVVRLIAAGHWREADPDILIVMDSGYDGPRLAHVLADLPVEIVVRLRSDRVMLRDPEPPRSTARGGRPRRHGGVLTLAQPASWHTPDATSTTETTRYGKAEALAWDRMHPRLQRRGPWLEYTDAELPVLHGTLIRLQLERLPGERDAKPLWLWSSATALTSAEMDVRWHALLRRFDLEHTFRFMKQVLGWTAPKIRRPDSADLWTWLIIAAHTQLRLARSLAEDLRRPWEKPAPPNRLSPARVRRGFRHIRAKVLTPAVKFHPAAGHLETGTCEPGGSSFRWEARAT
ncbi:NF041680 family putative transposase [Kitasatospora sp. NPDC002227]|uniref:NF041680 family putative transposase n=1 Tax=Kitasatospora sp. NPDC002227 TaxID=3154773 RepID=UPI003333047D